MIKKLWKIICWPWTKYVEWLGTGLPEKNGSMSNLVFPNNIEKAE